MAGEVYRPPTRDPEGLYIHSRIYTTTKGETHYSIPERLPRGLIDPQDFIYHVVAQGERIHDIAVTYYRGQYPDPVSLWEPLAQLQDPPIQNPERPLSPGSTVKVPGIDILLDIAYGQSLVDSPEI